VARGGLRSALVDQLEEVAEEELGGAAADAPDAPAVDVVAVLGDLAAARGGADLRQAAEGVVG